MERSATSESSGKLAACFAAIDARLRNDRLWIALAASVIALQLALVFAHEAWHDEYQALLIALQSPDLQALIGNLHYEGHPPLWYLILRAAAVAIPAAWLLTVVQAVIATALQALILFRAPASRLERLFAATGFFILIDDGMMARGFSLGILLFTAAMIVRDQRVRWLAIAFLPMTDFLFGVLSLVCIALEFRRGRVSWLGLIAWAACSALAAWSITMPADIIPAMRPDSVGASLIGWLSGCSALLIPWPFVESQPVWDVVALPLGLAVVAGIAFLIFADRQLVTRPFERTLLLGVIAMTAGLSCFAYQLSPRLLSVMGWTLVLLCWRREEGEAPPGIAFVLWLGVGSLCGLTAAAIALVTPFDFSPRAAVFIERNHLQNEHWIAFPFPTGAGISALTGIEFDRLGDGSCLQTFSRWNHKDGISDNAMLNAEVRHAGEIYGKSYLISRFPLDLTGQRGEPKLLKSFTGAYDAHDFYLYVIAPDRPVTGLKPPRCAPANWRPLALGI